MRIDGGCVRHVCFSHLLAGAGQVRQQAEDIACVEDLHFGDQQRRRARSPPAPP